MGTVKEQIAIVKKHIQSELKRSSLEYLKLGLELFHKERKGSAYPRVQPAIGNLSTSVELMIKAFLSAQNPLLIFTDLPLDLKILLLSPEQVPTNTNWRAYDLELRSFGYKTIELNDSISAYGVYFPEEKKKLQSYFKLLSHIRNKSLHASLPSFQTYDLERIGY